jgi:amino acid transporter
VAIVAYAACVLALALAGTFAANATLAAIVRLVYYALTCIALVIFRRRALEAPGFRLAGASVVTPLALVFCLYLLSTRTFSQGWILAAIIVAGLPFYWTAKKRGAAPAVSA